MRIQQPRDFGWSVVVGLRSATTQSTYRSLSYTDTTGTQLVEQATLIQVGNRLAWLTFTTDAGSAPAPHDSPVRRDAVQLSNQLTD